MEFVRFPRTPHIAWLGPSQPRDDKLLSPAEVDDLLRAEVVVEEKLDGANVGISTDEHGALRAQNRGSYIQRGHCHEQFKPLFRWLDSRRHQLAEVLMSDLILFGEWCYAVHSIHYTRLPDWFLVFDVFDRRRDAFWGVEARDTLADELGLALVPRIAGGKFHLAGLLGLLGPSQLTDGPAEGIYVRRDEAGHLAARGKLVRPEFTQAIEQHWSKRGLRVNVLACDAPASP